MQKSTRRGFDECGAKPTAVSGSDFCRIAIKIRKHFDLLGVLLDKFAVDLLYLKAIDNICMAKYANKKFTECFDDFGKQAHGSVWEVAYVPHSHYSLQKAHDLVRFFQARLLIVCLLSLLRAFDCLLNRRATLKRNFYFATITCLESALQTFVLSTI